MIKTLYQHYDELTTYFVTGAPTYLTENICPEKGLANGTPVALHSLTLNPSSQHNVFWNLVASSHGGEMIQLKEPPLSVNVKVSNVSALSWPANETLVSGEVVIPIQSNADPEILKVKHGSFKYYAYGYELAYMLAFLWFAIARMFASFH